MEHDVQRYAWDPCVGGIHRRRAIWRGSSAICACQDLSGARSNPKHIDKWAAWILTNLKACCTLKRRMLNFLHSTYIFLTLNSAAGRQGNRWAYRRVISCGTLIMSRGLWRTALLLQTARNIWHSCSIPRGGSRSRAPPDRSTNVSFALRYPQKSVQNAVRTASSRRVAHVCRAAARLCFLSLCSINRCLSPNLSAENILSQ